MAGYNGLGTYVRFENWTNDAAAGIKIRADRFDIECDGYAAGLSNAICKDGQTTVTANLPMATFRHTGVGDGAARTDYASLGQLQDSNIGWIAGGGTADAVTAAYSPAVTALTDGMILSFRATAANATTTPTFSPNGLTARTIVKNGGAALDKGDITGNLAEYFLRYNLANTRWEILNPCPISEGTFVPTCLLGGAAVSMTYTTQVGRWTKKGRTCTFQSYTVLSAKGSSTGAFQAVLPFAATATANAYATLAVTLEAVTGVVGHIQAFVAPSGTAASIEYLGTGTATGLDNTNVTNTTAVMVSGTYELA